MATKFLSPHHSPDDPGGVIGEVIRMGSEFPGPAEDVMLAWTLRLGVDRDPATLGIDLVEAQYRFDDTMSTCVVDFAAVTRVRDTGMMMLRAFCDGLARSGRHIGLRNGPSPRD